MEALDLPLAMVTSDGTILRATRRFRQQVGDTGQLATLKATTQEAFDDFLRSAGRSRNEVPASLRYGDSVLSCTGHRYFEKSLTGVFILVRLVSSRSFFADLTRELDAVEVYKDRERRVHNEVAGLRKRLASILEHAPSAVSVVGADGRYQLANAAFAQLVEVGEEHITGRLIAEVFPADVALLASGLVDGQKHETLEIRGESRTFLTRTFVVPDPLTRSESIGFVRTETTALVAADRREREREAGLLHTQKLESLGVLAGGIAHDFNNLLMGVLANAETARGLSREESAELRSSLHDIESASKTAAELCRQLLAYAGKGRFVVQPIHLSEVVRDMVELLRVSLSKKTTIVLELESDMPYCAADASQMRQVIMNLVTNASESLGTAGGTVSIRSGVESVDGRQNVYVRVTDDGAGMDEETQERIFDPFFTTKFTGRGLGLSAVSGIVRGHHGGLRVDSRLGQGSTFTLSLPVTGEVPAAVSAPLAVGIHEGCVLIVDDERLVRRAARRILRRAGYRVVEASDGEEAVELIENGKRFDAILLDMTMPRMHGSEAYRRIRSVDEVVPVVLSSGYNETEATELIVGQSNIVFLQKPYVAAQLLSALSGVRSVSDEQRS